MLYNCYTPSIALQGFIAYLYDLANIDIAFCTLFDVFCLFQNSAQLNSKYKNKSSLHLLYHTFFKFSMFLQVLFEFLWETSVFPRLPKFFWVLFFLVLARHSLIWIDGEIFDEPTVEKKILIFVYKISKTIIKHIIKAFQKEYLNEIWERQENIKQYWKYNIKAVKFEWIYDQNPQEKTWICFPATCFIRNNT